MTHRAPTLCIALSGALLVFSAGCDRKQAPSPTATTASAAAPPEPDPEPPPSPEEIARRREAAECKALVRTAVQHMGTIQEATKQLAATSSADDIERLAISFDDAAAALAALPLAFPDTRRLSSDYQKNLTEMAALCRKMAASARKKTLAGMEGMQAAFAKAELQDAAAVRRINDHCAPIVGAQHAP